MSLARFPANGLHLTAHLHIAKKLKLQFVFVINGDLEDICYILPFASLGTGQIQKRLPEFA